MSPPTLRQCDTEHSFPRVSGDEPIAENGNHPICKFSPRERG